MKKKNGFTLIELLAVIVILAIIALIATPIVLGLISRARKGAATDAAYGVRKEAQLVYSTALMEHPTAFDKIVVDFTKETTVNGKKYAEAKYYENANTTDDTAKNNVVLFEIDGTKPSSGTITISGNGTIIYSDIKINGYDCTIPESGEITCGGSGSSNNNSGTTPVSVESYGYSIASSGYNANDATTLTYTRPTDKNAYVKYTLTNGEVATGTEPEVCIYSDTYGGELCLKPNEFETSEQKIKDYFGYNANTWVNTFSVYWDNSSENATITCMLDSSNSNSSCSAYDSGVGAGYSYGDPVVVDLSADFRCTINHFTGVSCN